MCVYVSLPPKHIGTHAVREVSEVLKDSAWTSHMCGQANKQNPEQCSAVSALKLAL